MSFVMVGTSHLQNISDRGISTTLMVSILPVKPAAARTYVRVGSCLLITLLHGVGVPQGSVFGAIHFLLYYGDLQLIIESHGLCTHLYADNSQIYMYGSRRPSAYPELQSRISLTCIDHVAEWMRSNRIQLNAAKTEISGQLQY